MKIAIIAYSCRSGGGLFQTLNLLKALKDVVTDERFLIVCSAGCGYEDIELPDGSELYVYEGAHSILQRYWFELVTLPKVVANFKPDVVFGPGNVGLTKPGVPQALYIRNAYFFYDKKHYPDMFLRSKLRLASLKPQLKRCISASDLIFCQTPVVKKRFSEKYAFPKEKIKVLSFPPPAEIVPVIAGTKHDALDNSSENFYFFLLANYAPHRNPRVLLDLCEQHADNFREKKIKFITTVEPYDHPHARKFLHTLKHKHYDEIIINIGSLSRDEVVKYLSESDVLWLPTLLECLSTVYLEAMSMGLPILTPKLDFAEYACGDAAVYYDPWEIDDLFEKIVMLREDWNFLSELAAKGKQQLSNRLKFPASWQEVAHGVLKNLRQLTER